MYCSFCGTPLAKGLSFCNRCGANLKEGGKDKQSGAIVAFLTAITLLGIVGLGIILGGAISLKNDAHLEGSTIILFMVLTFLIVATTEILLVRQLSRLTGASEKKQFFTEQSAMSNELRTPQIRTLPEPIPSVTENTTRTLEYSQRKTN
jgi:predicted nucleic acid-binding Zn ribbon protein